MKLHVKTIMKSRGKTMKSRLKTMESWGMTIESGGKTIELRGKSIELTDDGNCYKGNGISTRWRSNGGSWSSNGPSTLLVFTNILAFPVISGREWTAITRRLASCRVACRTCARCVVSFVVLVRAVSCRLSYLGSLCPIVFRTVLCSLCPVIRTRVRCVLSSFKHVLVMSRHAVAMWLFVDPITLSLV